MLNEDGRLPPAHVLAGIEEEQRSRQFAVEFSWRLGSAIVIGAVVVSPVISWVFGLTLIAAMIIAARWVELENRACTSRIGAVRRAMMMLQEGGPSENVERLSAFLNSPGMVPSISRRQRWRYRVWTAVVVVVIVARMVESFA